MKAFEQLCAGRVRKLPALGEQAPLDGAGIAQSDGHELLPPVFFVLPGVLWLHWKLACRRNGLWRNGNTPLLSGRSPTGPRPEQ